MPAGQLARYFSTTFGRAYSSGRLDESTMESPITATRNLPGTGSFDQSPPRKPKRLMLRWESFSWLDHPLMVGLKLQPSSGSGRANTGNVHPKIRNPISSIKRLKNKLTTDTKIFLAMKSRFELIG